MSLSPQPQDREQNKNNPLFFLFKFRKLTQIHNKKQTQIQNTIKNHNHQYIKTETKSRIARHRRCPCTKSRRLRQYLDYVAVTNPPNPAPEPTPTSCSICDPQPRHTPVDPRHLAMPNSYGRCHLSSAHHASCRPTQPCCHLACRCGSRRGLGESERVKVDFGRIRPCGFTNPASTSPPAVNPTSTKPLVTRHRTPPLLIADPTFVRCLLPVVFFFFFSNLYLLCSLTLKNQNK